MGEAERWGGEGGEGGVEGRQRCGDGGGGGGQEPELEMKTGIGKLELKSRLDEVCSSQQPASQSALEYLKYKLELPAEL